MESPGPNQKTTTRARSLRREQTSTESKLWGCLRNRQLGGVKFSRRVATGPFFADFCCREAKLVIEIDGVTHETPEELAGDSRRTAWLEAQGYRVIRFRNEELMGELDAVLERIQFSIWRWAPHPPIAAQWAPTLSP
jgi:very-short-patch-repair endonuclease